MKNRRLDMRIPEESYNKIKNIAIEGNVSQWVRLLIQKELGKVKKIKTDWTFADGSTTEIEVTKGEFGISVIDLETGEDLKDEWNEKDFPELKKL